MHHSDPAFQALHVVRLRGRVTTEAVAESLTESLGAAGNDVLSLLQAAVDAGHLVYREGRAAGWSLTPEGRRAHEQLVAEDRATSGAADVVQVAYERFAALNQDLIAVCTSWQVKPDGGLNDHSDASYDAGTMASLGAIDDRVQPVCAQLAASMSRFGGYGRRLSRALDRIRAGDAQWFTSPAVDSYHTVWFELHEDLLQTLGIARAADT